MKKLCFFALAAVVLLAGCNKEFQTPEIVVSKAVTTLEVGIAPATRTQMADAVAGERKVYWSDGDKININGTASDALSSVPEETESTSFTFGSVLSTPYNVLYPASIYVDATHVNLPAIQAYDAKGFADGFFPMAGYSADGSSISVSHLCAVLKISVKRATVDADTDNIVAVRVKGRNNEQVSGNIAITYNPAALAAEDGASAAEKEVKVIQNQATSTAAAVDYFIVIPARTYANGIDVIVQDVNGHIMTKSKTSSWTPVAGHQYDMPEFEFVPTGTELGIEISNAAQLIAFAQAYNAREYNDLGESLVASLTADITFDASSSATFNTTGGIGNKDGSGNNYFLGVFDGKNHTISGLEATVPLFAYTDAGSTVKDLTLDNTCSLTIDSPAAETMHAPLVGRNKGLVSGCTSNADVTINNIQDVTTKEQHYGALVGRNYGGTIKDCNAGGNITCAQTGQTITANAVYIGGIAGSQAVTGSVKDTNFTGNITLSDGNTYGGITATGIYFYVGGIIGYADDGVISGCDVATSLDPKAMDVRGTFVPALGGVVGWVKLAAGTEISDCNNYMSLSFASEGARANTTPCRVGGIASRSAADISGCNNYGAIATVSNSTTIYLGGIVGDGAGVSKCENKASGTITRTSQTSGAQSNRYIYIGGIMAANNAACDVDQCTNNAAILNKTPGTSTATTLDVGGIVGQGVNQVDITGCHNLGNVTAQETTNTTATTRVAIGGILGYGPIASTTITDSDNSGQVYCQYNSSSKANNRRSYTGGIAGLMGTNADGVAGLEIGNCNNTGVVWSRNYNNIAASLANSSFGGGIVGAINGDAGSKASVHDCTSSTGKLTNYRGINGGIAGYAGNATLASNTASQIVDANANAEGNGGVVGWAVASSLSECTYSGTISLAVCVGGLVYMLDGSSSISNCYVNGASITKGTNDAAVLVNIAESGATITDCGVKGTLDAEAITLGSVMIATNGGATLSGTYLIP